jgi:hypothetical protein
VLVDAAKILSTVANYQQNRQPTRYCKANSGIFINAHATPLHANYKQNKHPARHLIASTTKIAVFFTIQA